MSPIASLRFTDLPSRPTELLDFKSLTLDAFQLLLVPFEAAFQAHMAAWRLDGKPRTARRFTKELERLKWFLWHGNVYQALQRCACCEPYP
jgi:hypothetical protein